MITTHDIQGYVHYSLLLQFIFQLDNRAALVGAAAGTEPVRLLWLAAMRAV